MYFKVIVFLAVLFVNFDLIAQSFYFGPKLGPAANFQRWNDFSADPLLSLNGDIFIETAPEDEKNFLYASVGYRVRGSAWRLGNVGSGINFNSTKFQFRNAALEFGAKRMLISKGDSRPYYFLGLRLEYTFNTNLDQYNNTVFFPNNAFVRKINYGGSFGGGYEMKFRDMMKFFIEIGIHPDITAQYYQPELFNVPDPFFPGQNRNISEREIRNMSLELKFGMKFLRKVEYY
jgi:hypothetical protein